METITKEIVWQGQIYEIEAEIHRYREHYGADADGNRGIDRECYEINRQKVFKFVGDDAVELKDAEISVEFQKAIERTIDNAV